MGLHIHVKDGAEQRGPQNKPTTERQASKQEADRLTTTPLYQAWCLSELVILMMRRMLRGGPVIGGGGLSHAHITRVSVLQ